MKKGIIILSVLFVLLLLTVVGSGRKVFDFGFQAVDTEVASAETGEGGEVSAGKKAAPGTEARFQFLAEQRSNSCSLQPETVITYPDERRLQGSCCAPMDLHRYQEQVAALRQYADIPQIPEDPYDISAGLAKELLGYQDSITLSPEQQELYDRAVELSDEGGPCCCQCWRWYAFEGQAKYLITQHNWTAEQIGDLWTMEDGCGGEGHDHST